MCALWLWGVSVNWWFWCVREAVSFFFSIIAHAAISSDNFLPRLVQSRLLNKNYDIYVTLQNETIFLLNEPWSVSCLWKYTHQSFSYSSVNQKNMISDAFVMKCLLKNNSCVCEESTPKRQRCLKTNKGNPNMEIRLSCIMMTSSNGSIFHVNGLCTGNSPVTGEFPSERPMKRSFDLRLSKRLNKQSRRR